MISRLIKLASVFAIAAGLSLGAAGSQAGGIAPKLVIDKSKGQCVLPPEQMKRQHMKLLKHRRDETMFNGVRGGKVSLRACVTCHAIKGDDGKFVTIKSEKHFCRTCHDYIAVKPDCWDCHVSVPDKAAGHAALKRRAGTMRAEASGLIKYLEGGQK